MEIANRRPLRPHHSEAPPVARLGPEAQGAQALTSTISSSGSSSSFPPRPCLGRFSEGGRWFGGLGVLIWCVQTGLAFVFFLRVWLVIIVGLGWFGFLLR